MPTNVFVIHGSYGHPGENWFPWLKDKLRHLGCHVFVPQFPTPENQSLKNWLYVFEKYQSKLDDHAIVVGHSIGSAFLLDVLEMRDKPIKAAFLISGFTGSLKNSTFDRLNETIADKDFDWDKIKRNCQKFIILHSDDDPYVPLHKANELAKKLGSEVTLVKNAGHFNKSAGYLEFDLLLKLIEVEL